MSWADRYRPKSVSELIISTSSLEKISQWLDPLPTQLYVTTAGPTREIFNDLLNPVIGNAWENFNRTLDLLPSLDTRKVIRHTLVKDVNMPFVDEYTKMDRTASPDFIESKGYVHVGQSITRLTTDNMPSHDYIVEFSRELANNLGYDFTAERRDSRVTLLSKDPSKARIDFSTIKASQIA